jgi:hypothetical protein
MDLLSGDAMISGGKQLANHELYCGKASLKFNGPLIDPLHFFTFNPQLDQPAECSLTPSRGQARFSPH